MFRINKGRVVTVISGAAVIGLVGAGGAVAGSTITSAQIQNQSIHARDIHAGGVSTSEIRDQSVRQRDIHQDAVGWGELTPWVQNKVNKRGPEGAPGQDGVSGVVIPAESFTSLPDDGRDTFGVYCPEGTNAIGGGVDWEGGAVVTANKPWWGTYGSGNESNDPNRAVGWNAEGQLNGGKITVWAICATIN